MLNECQERFLTNRKIVSQSLCKPKIAYTEVVKTKDVGFQGQNTGSSVFQCELHCDQTIAHYMQIYGEFKQKVGRHAFEGQRFAMKPNALISCFMKIQMNGKVALCSQQSSEKISNYRVRFASIKRGENFMEVGMVSLINGYQIKLTMQLIHYYSLLMELNNNKIKFFTYPKIQVKYAWLMLDKKLSEQKSWHSVQWLTSCSFNGEESCFIARISYKFEVYKLENEIDGFVKLHEFSSKEDLRMKEDREWYFVGSNWISFSNASDRQLFKIYYTVFSNDNKLSAKTEMKNLPLTESGRKNLTAENRPDMSNTGELGYKSTDNQMSSQGSQKKQSEQKVAKKLQFSEQKERQSLNEKNKAQMQNSEQKQNKDSELIQQQKDQDWIIVDESEFEVEGNVERLDDKVNDCQMQQQLPEQVEFQSDHREFEPHFDEEQPEFREASDKEQIQKGKVFEIHKSSCFRQRYSEKKPDRLNDKQHYEKQNCSRAANGQDCYRDASELKSIQIQVEYEDIQGEQYNQYRKNMNQFQDEIQDQKESQEVIRYISYLSMHDKSKALWNKICEQKPTQNKISVQQQQIPHQTIIKPERTHKETQNIISSYDLRNKYDYKPQMKEEIQIDQEDGYEQNQKEEEEMQVDNSHLNKMNKNKQSITSNYWLRHIRSSAQKTLNNNTIMKAQSKYHQKLKNNQAASYGNEGKSQAKGMTAKYDYESHYLASQDEGAKQTNEKVFKTKQKPRSFRKNTNPNQFIDILQISSQKFAVINANHQLMVCQCDISYKYDQYSTDMQWMNQLLSPVKLFLSNNPERLNYIENSTSSIFSFDFNKNRHMPIVQRADFISDLLFKDIKQTSNYQFIVLHEDRIKFADSRERGSLRRRDLHYRTHNSSFSKIALQNQHTAVVSQTDGIIKIFDLRANHLRALNKFVLQDNMKIKKTKPVNDELKILQDNKGIFCTFDNSGYLISSHSISQNQSAFDTNIHLADRQISKFDLSRNRKSQGQHTQTSYYDINRRGDLIIHIEKNRFECCDVETREVSCLTDGAGNVGYFGFDLFGGDDVKCCYMEQGGYLFKKMAIE